MVEGPSETPDASSRNLFAFGATSFLNDTASEMAYWVLPAFLASIGAGPAQLGIIEGIAESVASFAKLFSGYLADRVRRRKAVVVSGYFVANTVKPLLALASSWRQILGIRFGDRFAKGIRGTTRDVMLADSVPESRLGSAYGLLQAMDSAGALAVAALRSARCVLVCRYSRSALHYGSVLRDSGGRKETTRKTGSATTSGPATPTFPREILFCAAGGNPVLRG